MIGFEEFQIGSYSERKIQFTFRYFFLFLIRESNHFLHAQFSYCEKIFLFKTDKEQN